MLNDLSALKSQTHTLKSTNEIYSRGETNYLHASVTHQLKEHTTSSQRFLMQSISVKRSETLFVFLVIAIYNVFSCPREKTHSYQKGFKYTSKHHGPKISDNKLNYDYCPQTWTRVLK